MLGPSITRRPAPSGGYRSTENYPARSEGSPAFTTHAVVPFPKEPPFTAFIGNLAFEATENEISNYFPLNIKVKTVRLMMDRAENKPRGYGYVEFEDLDSLKQATEMSGGVLAGRNIRITVAERKFKCKFDDILAINISKLGILNNTVVLVKHLLIGVVVELLLHLMKSLLPTIT